MSQRLMISQPEYQIWKLLQIRPTFNELFNHFYGQSSLVIDILEAIIYSLTIIKMVTGAVPSYPHKTLTYRELLLGGLCLRRKLWYEFVRQVVTVFTCSEDPDPPRTHPCLVAVITVEKTLAGTSVCCCHSLSFLPSCNSDKLLSSDRSFRHPSRRPKHDPDWRVVSCKKENPWFHQRPN